MKWNFYEHGYDPCYGCPYINRPSICHKCDGPDDLKRVLDNENEDEDFRYESRRDDSFDSISGNAMLRDW